ncbi:MAG: hypothetical protein MUE69_16915 [Myxococcota bacterium]|jgi:hypothetical protein|nr:hypothetical protein [Myxococcota bacterium]
MTPRIFLRVLVGAFALTIAAASCNAGTGGRLVPVELRLVGDPSATRFTSALGFDVVLEEAELVVGPLYAFAPADEPITRRSHALRSIAHAHGGLDPLDGRKVRAELLDRVAVDALADEPVAFETLAEEGAIDELRVGLEAEPSQLDGHLARVVGTATRDGVTYAFEAFVDVGASPNERRVLVPFVAELTEGSLLTLRLDPRAWLDGVAFDRLGACEAPCGFAGGSQAATAAALGVRSVRAYAPRLD